MPSKPRNASAARLRRLSRQAGVLSAARTAAGLSQYAAADLFGVSVWTYRSWEHGLRQPSPEVRGRLVSEWGCDPKVLGAEATGICPGCGRPY